MILKTAKHYKQYQQDDISTSSQGKLILMMYEGAIKNTSMAIDCIQQKDIPGKGLHISKAHDIINELSLALDMEKGGEITKRLERLYQFMLSQLALANIKSETKILKTVFEILNTLLGGWTEIIYKQKAEEPNSPKQSIKKIASRC